MIVMIHAARHTPITIAGNAFLKRIPSRAAINAPVQAPVPGSGIPTNATNPQNSYFSILALWLIAFFSSFSTTGFNLFVPFIQSKIFVIRSRIKGIGSRFPMIPTGIARHIGIFRNAGPAASSPPRNSRIPALHR